MTIDISKTAVEAEAERLRTGVSFDPADPWTVRTMPKAAALLSALSARVKELETALKPFASAAAILDKHYGDYKDEIYIAIGMDCAILHGDFRRARSVLTPQTAPRTDHGSQWPSDGDNRR